MAWSQSDLDALDAAIKKGARTVQFKDGSVTYHSLDELLRLRDTMRDEIEGTSAPDRTSFAEHCRN